MEVQRGHGFQGVMMLDDVEDRVQCHICGKWFKMLAGHLGKAHDTNTLDYKIEYGLPLKIGLCSPTMSAVKSRLTLARFKGKRDGFTRSAGTFVRGFHKRRKYRRAYSERKTAFHRNKFGICELQMKSRYDVVQQMCGHVPDQEEVRKYDQKLYKAMWNYYKGLNGFRKAHGIPLKFGQTGHSEIAIAAFLRKLAFDLKRRPNSMDVKAGGDISRQTIYNRFGSWKAAMAYSGIK